MAWPLQKNCSDWGKKWHLLVQYRTYCLWYATALNSINLAQTSLLMSFTHRALGIKPDDIIVWMWLTESSHAGPVVANRQQSPGFVQCPKELLCAIDHHKQSHPVPSNADQCPLHFSQHRSCALRYWMGISCFNSLSIMPFRVSIHF